MQMISRTDGRPYMNVIFGNFYSPAYDDETFIDETMALIRRLGFNSVMFDTKAWEDFRERCEGGAPSQYVKMQEYMGRAAHRHGLAYNFLLLYLNGDNLYPHIRYSPPIFGEETVGPDGRPGRWYKYWSEKARASMEEHVERILRQYGDGCERCLMEETPQATGEPRSWQGGLQAEKRQETEQSVRQEATGESRGRQGSLQAEKRQETEQSVRQEATWESRGRQGSLQAEERQKNSRVRQVLPVCSMWDPVAAPSFDEDGRNRYLAYLRGLYGGDLELLNRNYGMQAQCFEELLPEEYWYSLRYGQDSFYTEEDVRNRSAKFWVWRDNAFWKIHELILYFREIGPGLKKRCPELFLCPDMTQWGYFLNIFGRSQQDHDNEFSDLWDTAMRGIDIYALAPYVDSCHFITVPATPDGYPDAYVVSCQHSMMRVMNEGKPMIGGIYWGRYIYNDLYAFLTPAELIGSMAACGMDGYTCYGMNGLDDGGVLNRMEPDFLESLKLANEWFAKLVPLRRGERKKEIALLFPSEMAHLEPFEVGDNKIRRLDLLGWYRLCCDLGFQTDVISSHEIEKGRLEDYRILIVPANDCYFAAEHPVMEQTVRAWVQAGGIVLHGPLDTLSEHCFGIRGETCEKMPYRYGSTVIPQGVSFCRYPDGEELAAYTDGGGCCTAVYTGKTLAEKMGDGRMSCAGAVYSFGVQIGASYAAKNIPHVPYDQGNKEMYPFTLSGTALVQDILYRHLKPAGGICERGIETGVFENGMVIVNHRSTPYTLPETYRTELYQYPFHAGCGGRGVLGAHEAVWVSREHPC